MTLRQIIFGTMLGIAASQGAAQTWPTSTPECKPGARWWWMGSAVTESDLKWNMEQYAKTGIGPLEITPIYGVQNNEKNELKKKKKTVFLVIKK